MSSILTLHSVSGVPKMDTFGHADPYVKVHTPATDSEPKFRTKTIKNTACAEFGETFLVESTCRLVIYDEDMVKDEVMGEVTLNLATSVRNHKVAVKDMSGKDIPNCFVTYSFTAADDAALASVIKRTEKLQYYEVQPGAELSFGVSWDGAETDVDLVCIALDATGLVVDAAYYNQLVALGGAMRHHGDHKDGATSGIDEVITVSTAAAPPNVMAFVFCLQCNGQSTLSLEKGGCTVHVSCPATGAAFVQLNITNYVKNATFAIVGALKRKRPAGWEFEEEVLSLGSPVRDFVVALPQILNIVNIDPLLAKELKGAQPTFHLKKGDSALVPGHCEDVTFGLGWDAGCDVDSSCVGLRADGTEAFRVYFGNKNWMDIVVHSGDNTTGVGSGDDEQIKVRLGAMPQEVTSIFFTVNVYSSSKNFRDVKGEYCRLIDTAPGRNNHEVMRFQAMDSGDYNGIVLVGLHRAKVNPKQWQFEAISYPAPGRTVADLIDECQMLQRKRKSSH